MNDRHSNDGDGPQNLNQAQFHPPHLLLAGAT